MSREKRRDGLSSRKRRWIAGFAALVSIPVMARPAAAEGLSPQQQLAFDIYKELVEINTVTATGDTARAAEAMAARLQGRGLCGRRHSGVPAGAAQGQSGRPAARQRRAQADPAAGASRRGAGQPRGLVGRSVQADREGRLLTMRAAAATTNTWRRPLSPISFATSRKATSPTATSSSRWRPTRKSSTATRWASSGCSRTIAT